MASPSPTPGVTWIHVDRPQLDLVGLILGALGLTGTLALLALALGVVLGVGLVLRSRNRPPAAPPLPLGGRSSPAPAPPDASRQDP